MIHDARNCVSPFFHEHWSLLRRFVTYAVRLPSCAANNITSFIMIFFIKMNFYSLHNPAGISGALQTSLPDAHIPADTIPY